MAITVQMIEDKEFSIKFKGYDQEEVNEFLDQICDEMVAMQDEINSLQQRLRSQVTPPGAFGSVPAPSLGKTQTIPAQASVRREEPQPVVQEAPRQDNTEAARKLLASAQQVYDQMISDAKREAEEIVNGARVRAESAVGDLEQEKARINQEIEMLKSTAKDYRSRFMRLLEDQTHVLNSESELFKDDADA